MVTSGYISQLPIIPFTEEEKKKLTIISKEVLEGKLKIEEALIKINLIVYENLKFDMAVIQNIDDFALNLSKRV